MDYLGKMSNTCRKFMNEWRGYYRDDDGKIKKGNDHLMNALEFAITDGMRLGQTKSQYLNDLNYGAKPMRI